MGTSGYGSNLPDELKRLAALRSTRLLDTAAEERFDRLTRLATRILRAPIAMVSLVDNDRQFFKSCVGVSGPVAEARQTPLTHSFCKYAVAARKPLIVSDAREHPLLRDNPSVIELGVIAYAGIPLVTAEGLALGSFCVIDVKPRQWTDDDLESLKDLAASVMTEIELTLSVAALEEVQGRLGVALGAAQVGLWEWDVRTNEMNWTDQLKRQLGLPPEAIPSYAEWVRRIHPDDRAAAGAKSDESARTGAPYAAEYRVVWPDGVVRWMSVRGQPFLDALGRVDRIAGATADITGPKAHEEESRRAREAAESANRAKDQFLAVLSHELRTPLSPVLMIATSMAADAQLPPAVRDDARTIQRNVELQTRLIDDLLDVTRIENGKLSLHAETVDVHDALKDCLAMAAGAAAAKGVAVTLNPLASRSLVTGDPVRLRQVFSNLLNNAVKFTPKGGNVVIRTEESAANRTEDSQMKTEPKGGEVVGAPSAAPSAPPSAPPGSSSPASVLGSRPSVLISISDTGIGIDPSAIGSIYNPFEQGGRAMTNEFSGLGLGLAITRGLVEAHQGTISAASSGRGCGTTMTVSLPAAGPAALRPAVAAARPPGLAQQLSILLVDDHHDTLQAMSRLLRRLEHRVITASSVAAALSAADREPFDLLISDIGLPDGTGLELMGHLLARRPIKGIALTGYGTETDIEKTRTAGFMAHLTKPINFHDVEAMLQKMGGD